MSALRRLAVALLPEAVAGPLRRLRRRLAVARFKLADAQFAQRDFTNALQVLEHLLVVTVVDLGGRNSVVGVAHGDVHAARLRVVVDVAGQENHHEEPGNEADGDRSRLSVTRSKRRR